MKKILAILLVISSLLCLASCAGGGAGADTTAHDHAADTLKKEPEKKPEPVKLDNELLTEGGSINLTPSDYRVVDETEDGYVIIRMNNAGVIRIHKVIEFETNEEAVAFLVKITKDGTAKNYRELGQVANYFYYTLDQHDEKYGKFTSMTREKVLEAFGRDSQTTAPVTDEHGHQH